MNALEALLYELSKLFLAPVLLVLCAMFLFALFEFGRLLLDLALRWRGRPIRGSLARYLRRHPHATQELLELRLLKLIEPLRIASRVAPMLGLVATMIPMGPALIAVAAGEVAGMAENLVVAFAAVVIALLSASICYVVLTLRRRWLLEELNLLLDQRQAHEQVALSGDHEHLAGAAYD